MIVLRTLIFLIACVLYPFRLVFYVIHSFLVFLGKPGARVILPLVIVFALWGYGFEKIPLLHFIAVVADSFFQGLFKDSPQWAAFVTQWREMFPAVVAWFVLRIAFDIVMALLRPLVHALPAPRRPLAPMAPLYVPKHVVKTIRARVAVSPLRMGRYKGNLVDIIPHLPPDIRDVLERRSTPAKTVGEIPKAPIILDTAPVTPHDPAPVQQKLPEPSPERPAKPPREAKIPRRRKPPQQTPPAPSREE